MFLLHYSNIPRSTPWSRSRVHNFLWHLILWFERFLNTICTEYTVIGVYSSENIWKFPFCDEVWEVVTPSCGGVWSSLTVRWKAEAFYFSLKRMNLMFSEHKVSASWRTVGQISKMTSSQPIFGVSPAVVFWDCSRYFFVCMYFARGFFIRKASVPGVHGALG